MVLETTASGVSELPFSTFLLLMQPIHLAIGIVGGARDRRRRALRPPGAARAARAHRGAALAAGAAPLAGASLAFAAAALVAGAGLARLASTRPDGLEWSITGAGSAPEQGAGSVASVTAAAVAGAAVVIAAVVLTGVVLHRRAARRRARAGT